MVPQDYNISVRRIALLRHLAVKYNIPIQQDGFIKISYYLDWYKKDTVCKDMDMDEKILK